MWLYNTEIIPIINILYLIKSIQTNIYFLFVLFSLSLHSSLLLIVFVCRTKMGTMLVVELYYDVSSN